MNLLPDTATLYCATFTGVIITPLVVSRSDYFRNFVDSCLQKIAQDRPTSDVLLKVRGIKRAVWCLTWEQAEACHCLFVGEHLSDHAWGNLKCKYSARGRSKRPFFPFQPHWHAASHKIAALFFSGPLLVSAAADITGWSHITALEIIWRAFEPQCEPSKGSIKKRFDVRAPVWSVASSKTVWPCASNVPVMCSISKWIIQLNKSSF